ncbi:MAG: DNA mismatch repair endonuclease MutL [Clostridia bacterium]|nr:DNA mismatch repair endonuclease MutL [Clostridia bacterium]
MGKINVLGFDVANLIAAGEVVDRPSSVVKELLENAIDSGATSVTVEIKKGGVSFIRVSDNGCGIEYEDLPVAILRHATSKIKLAKDLEAIMTLGFRGEALAAIASVSKMRIMSKTPASDYGGMLTVEGGEVISHSEAGCAEGTTVIVEEIFFNVPARRKFLKKDMTEAIAVSAVVEKVALSMPQIAFKLISDGEVKFATSGDGNLLNAIYTLLGRDFAMRALPVDRTEDGIRVSGYISNPELTKSNRNFQNFYINGRYIKSRTVTAAVEQAYLSYSPSDRFPLCVLNLQIEPSTVDVNVHPAKLEVKFSNEKLIFDGVYYAIRSVLENRIVRPEFNVSNTKKENPVHAFVPVVDRASEQKPAGERITFGTDGKIRIGTTAIPPAEGKKIPPAPEPVPAPESQPITAAVSHPTSERRIPDMPNEQPVVPQPKFSPDESTSLKPKATPTPSSSTGYDISFGFAERMKKLTPEKETPQPVEIPVSVPEKAKAQPASIELSSDTPVDVPEYVIIGEAFNSYVILQVGEKLLLIDKHAAHERILFEDLKKKVRASERSSQVLLLPIDIRLSTDELTALSEWEEDIRATGFAFSLDGNVAKVSEIPSDIDISAATDMFAEFVNRLIHKTGDPAKAKEEFFEAALYQASCKAAIKAGRYYDRAHIQWICDRVLTMPDIKVCPHGRPVAFEITKHSIEKQFSRV